MTPLRWIRSKLFPLDGVTQAMNEKIERGTERLNGSVIELSKTVESMQNARQKRQEDLTKTLDEVLRRVAGEDR